MGFCGRCGCDHSEPMGLRLDLNIVDVASAREIRLNLRHAGVEGLYFPPFGACLRTLGVNGSHAFPQSLSSVRSLPSHFGRERFPRFPPEPSFVFNLYIPSVKSEHDP